MRKMYKFSVLMSMFVFCGILTTYAGCDKEYVISIGGTLQVYAPELFKMDFVEPAVFTVTKNGEDIPLRDGILYIPNMQVSDAGVYIFTATTRRGDVFIRAVCVIVTVGERELYKSSNFNSSENFINRIIVSDGFKC